MLNNNTVSLKNVFDFFLSRRHMKCESENEKKNMCSINIYMYVWT